VHPQDQAKCSLGSTSPRICSAFTAVRVRPYRPPFERAGNTCREVCNLYLVLAAARQTSELSTRITTKHTGDIGVFLELGRGRIGTLRALTCGGDPAEVLMRVTNLRVEVAGLGIFDYRDNDGQVEFRALNRDGRAFSDQRSTWRRLTPSDIALHMRFETVVGKWVQDRVAQWRT
jgi:hypothetical protein